MILAKLRGCLSNQMFQYAAARRLAHRHNTEVRIDASWYRSIPPGATPRRYELDQLCISGRVATRWETIGADGSETQASSKCRLPSIEAAPEIPLRRRKDVLF